MSKYPYLAVHNKAKLTIYNNGNVFTTMFLPTEEDAKQTLVDIGQRFGRLPTFKLEKC